MKAKRRQELKTNDLAQWLEDASISFKDWGVYIVGGVAVVVVAVAISWYVRTAQAEQLSREYAELRTAANLSPSGIQKSPQEIRDSIETMGDLAAGSSDPGFKLDALLSQGATALNQAETAEGGIDAALLEQARAAFEEVARDFRERKIYYGRALFALYRIEADLYSVDGDMAHKSKAVEYLGKLRDDERLAGTPFQTQAVELLNEVDSIFTVVEFPKKPAGEAIPGLTPAAPGAPTINPVRVAPAPPVSTNG